MNTVQVKRMFVVCVTAIAANIVLLTALGLMNRSRPIAAPSVRPLQVRWERRPEMSAAPAPAEPTTVEQTPLPIPEVAVDLPLPSIQPLELPAATFEATVRIARPSVRHEPLPQAVAEKPSAQSAPVAGPMGETEVDVPPRPIHDPQPAYPSTAIRRRIEGHVRVDLLVDLEGNVAQLRIADRSGPPSFEQSVRQTVLSDWRFEPGRHQDQPVLTWVSRRIYFRIQQ